MATPTIRVGGTLGRYQLLEQIGAGGMGVVFRAHDQRLARDVAIKLLAPGSVLSVVARHRVRNEAMALSRLSHPNIETIFEFDSQDDCDFLVVELIPGTSLDELISRGPLPATLAVSLTLQLLRGLAAAHEKGIIHRDLKPSNLRLTPDSFLKILDFGIAHVEDETGQSHDLTTETHANVLSGTLTYMPPEQLRGAHLNPRSDLYAVGLILYQMCTGRLPFTESGALLIDAILNKPVPPPSKFNSDIGPPMERVILKALEKDPKQRYQSAREMLRDLEEIESPSGSSRGRPMLQIASVALLTLMLALIAVAEHSRITSWVQNRLHPVPAYKYVAVMPFRSVTNDDQAFDQGLTEAVAAKVMELTASQPVQVVSPRELQAEHVSDVSDAHKKLGVNLAVEGTLQQIDTTTRVNLELVDASARRLLRANNFTAQASDVFSLQDQVIEKTVQMLEIEIHKGVGEEGHGTTNSEAFTLYIRGVGFLGRSGNAEDVESAIAQLERSITLDPGYAAAYADLGIAYLDKYRETRDSRWISQAGAACEKSLSLNPQSLQGMICLGKLHLRTGENQQAASNFSVALEKDPSNDEALNGLANAYEKFGSISQAEAAYKRAISLRPNYAIGHMRLGLFYSHQAHYKQAAEEFEHATTLNADDPRPWSRLGGAYFYLGEYDQAISALQHALSIRPTFESYSNLGLSYFALRKFPEAISSFQQAIVFGPNEIQPYGNLGRAYFYYRPTHSLAREQLLKAMVLAEKDLHVNPTDSDAHLLAAEYSAMLGRRQEALDHLGSALKFQPKDAETLYFAAIVHAQLGETNEATAWLERAIRQGYSLAEINSAVELDDVRSQPRIQQVISAVKN